MEAYEIDQDKILSWATEYADYSELEATAKALYNVFKSRQREEQPKLYAQAKAYKKNKTKWGIIQR